MVPDRINNKLSVNNMIFKLLLQGISEKQQHWRPAENKWCMLEIAVHLLDEEKEDFKLKIDYIFNKPGEEWPKIDPEGWVQSRKYMENDFQDVVLKFHDEREQSLNWLSGLKDADWDKFYMHPVRGKMSAELLLVNWLAHDYFHIRQINRYNYEYLNEQSGIDLSYAGKW